MKIVIADDSVRIRQVWRAMLRNLGHEVVAEGLDGTEAIALCKEHRPDLALMDVSMGDIGGDAAALVIREQKTARFILLCTSRGSIKEQMEAKGIPVLIKPVMQGGLEKKIAEITQG